MSTLIERKPNEKGSMRQVVSHSEQVLPSMKTRRLLNVNPVDQSGDMCMHNVGGGGGAKHEN